MRWETCCDRRKRICATSVQASGKPSPSSNLQSAPLVIAAGQHEFLIFKDVKKYPHVYPAGLFGNADEERLDQLHIETWELLKPFFDRDRKTAIKKYLDAASTGLGTSDLENIVAAGANGRIEILLLTPNSPKWGR